MTKVFAQVDDKGRVRATVAKSVGVDLVSLMPEHMDALEQVLRMMHLDARLELSNLNPVTQAELMRVKAGERDGIKYVLDNLQAQVREIVKEATK